MRMGDSKIVSGLERWTRNLNYSAGGLFGAAAGQSQRGISYSKMCWGKSGVISSTVIQLKIFLSSFFADLRLERVGDRADYFKIDVVLSTLSPISLKCCINSRNPGRIYLKLDKNLSFQLIASIQLYRGLNSKSPTQACLIWCIPGFCL